VSPIGLRVESPLVSLLDVSSDALRNFAATALPVDVGDGGLGGGCAG
jgi:hypothetical protein